MSNVDFAAVLDRIKTCPGASHYQLLHSHHTAVSIFSTNYSQLKDLLDFIHDPRRSLTLFSTDNRAKLQSALTEVNRLFHNYVASAMTLVDHTRNIVGDLSVQEGFRQACRERISADFSDDLLTSFVQDLRNYFLHKGIPKTGTQISYTSEPKDLSTRVYLDIGRMTAWDGWKSKSRSYISGASDQLTLLDVVERYADKVRAFHEWFSQNFKAHHDESLAELADLQRQWNSGMGSSLAATSQDKP